MSRFTYPDPLEPPPPSAIPTTSGRAAKIAKAPDESKHGAEKSGSGGAKQGETIAQKKTAGRKGGRALMLGYSSLESPDPGAEPSDTQRPVADRAELTRWEHPVTGNESPQTKENAPGSVSHRGRSA